MKAIEEAIQYKRIGLLFSSSMTDSSILFEPDWLWWLLK